MASPIQRVTFDDDLVLDCSITERHATTVELTRHPIEEGADPTDHARKLPDRVSFEGLFTATPVDRKEAEARGNTGQGQKGYVQEQRLKLAALAENHRAIVIETEVRTYKNMVLSSLEEPRDAKTGDSMRFSVTFEEVRFVKSEIVRLELVTRPNNVPGEPLKKTDKGKQPVEEKPGMTSIMKGLSNDGGYTKQGSGLGNINLDELGNIL